MEGQDPSSQTTLLILLGASIWPDSPEFQGSEAFAKAARRVKDYFLHPRPFGLPAENLLDLFNSEKSADELDVAIEQFLKQRLAGMKATGNAGRDLVLYFIGHGGFVGRDSEYYLAIRRTRTGNPLASGLRVVSLAYRLTEQARHLRRIIILDCCFAAAAFRDFQAGPDQVALEKTIDAFRAGRKAEGFPTKGTTLFCSSDQKSPSLLLPDGSSTMFTEAFLDALVQGTPSQRDRLTLRDVKDAATDFLSGIRNAPRPVVHSPDQSEGDVADIPFFPNPRVEEDQARKAEEARVKAQQEEEGRRRAEEEERVRLEQARRRPQDRRHQLLSQKRGRAGADRRALRPPADGAIARPRDSDPGPAAEPLSRPGVPLVEEEKQQARLAEEERVKKAEEVRRIRKPKGFVSLDSLPDTFKRQMLVNWTIQSKEEARARPIYIKTWALIIGISILNLLSTSIWLGILLHAWWIAVICLIGELLLAWIVLGSLENYLVNHFSFGAGYRKKALRPPFLLIGLLPIGIAWGLVGWFLNPFVLLPLHFPYSTLILAVVGFLLGLFVNFFIYLLLVRVLKE